MKQVVFPLIALAGICFYTPCNAESLQQKVMHVVKEVLQEPAGKRKTHSKKISYAAYVDVEFLVDAEKDHYLIVYDFSQSLAEANILVLKDMAHNGYGEIDAFSFEHYKRLMWRKPGRREQKRFNAAYQKALDTYLESRLPQSPATKEELLEKLCDK